MNIGIDIDDTLTYSTKVVKEFVEKYDSYYCDDKHLINNIGTIIRGFLVDDETKRFFRDHSREIGEAIEIKEDAKEVIDRLRKEGHRIFIITARSDNFYGNAQEFCEEYLAIKNINYDKLITGQTYKIETCKNEKIDLMIDDAVDTCENVEKENIKTLLFTTDLNKDKETSCKRVNSWLEIYNIIQKM